MKYVVVTGAYGGIGNATIHHLRDDGYFVFALDYQIKEKEENIVPIQIDVTNENSVKNAFEEIQKYTNEIFAIIHLAGVYLLDSLVEMTSNEFKKVMDVNVYGSFIINKTFLSLLNKNSKIVHVTSELAPLDPLPFTGIYGISKTTLEKYAFSLRMELQLLDIDVCVVRAGAVKTKLLDKSTDDLDRFCEKTKLYKCNSKRFKQIVNKVETKCIEPEKIAIKIKKILRKRNNKFAYSINRNFGLILLSSLPSKLQFYIIRKILK